MDSATFVVDVADGATINSDSVNSSFITVEMSFGQEVVGEVATGARGPAGPGVPAGGTTGQILAKNSNADQDTGWVDPASGSVSSVNGASGAVSLDQDDIPDGITYKQYSAAEKSKLAGIATGATANDTDANLKNRSNHTGTQSSSTISDFTEAVQDAVASLLASGSQISLSYDDVGNSLTVSATGADAETMRDTIGAALAGIGLITVTVNDPGDTITISTTATANDTDANLKNRANHTGTQLAATISDFATAAQAAMVAEINKTKTFAIAMAVAL